MPISSWFKNRAGQIKEISRVYLSNIRFQTVLVAVTYFITARLSLILDFRETNVSPVWPPSGLAFAAVLLFGPRVWPGIFAGAVLANSIVFLDNMGMPVSDVFFLSFLIATGNTFEALVGIRLFRQLIRGDNPLFRTRDTFIFLGISIVMCLVGAFNGIVWLSLLEYVPWDLFYQIFFTWWSGDVTGVLTVLPVLWAFFPKSRRMGDARSRVVEFSLFLLCAVLSNALVFGGHTGSTHWPLEFTVFPIMIWGSTSFLRQGVGLMTLITAGYAVWGTLHGFGPFGHLPQNEALILVQLLVGMVSLTGMALAATLHERNHFFRELERSKLRFERIFEFSPVAKMIINAKGKIEMFNRQAEQVFGYSRREILGKDYAALLPEMIGTRLNIDRSDLLSLSVPRPLKLERDLFAVRKNGEQIPIELGLIPLEIDNRKHILSSVTDITLRKQSERILKESEARFRSMADHAPVMIWMAGTDAKCHFFNKSWLRFTGRSMNQECGDGWSEGVHPDDLKRCVDTYMSAFKLREKFTMDYRLRRADKTYRWILDSGVPLYSYNGTFEGYIGSCVDVTDLKDAQEVLARDKQTLANLVDEGFKQLSRAQQKLKQHNRLAGLGTLAATVAHELRNPLGVIQLASHNLKRKNKELENNKHLQNIEKKIFESNQIINNLLNYSSIKQPKHDLLNICEILDECVQAVMASVDNSQIHLYKEYPKDLECLIEADPFQIREIFNNILMNAVQSLKDHQGEICLQIMPAADSVSISIMDTGIGIDPADLSEIFQPFFTRKSKGTGLGLAICSELVNLHNGKIEVTSKIGGGTTMTVTLPKKRNHEPNPSYPDH
ncbi:MAG: MASE1 domain-containing protein [Candidatus Omnitrophota bacterium]